MSGELYELLAMAMRYIFVLMVGLIVFRAYRWLRRDAKAYQREMRALPDAGLVGEMVNLSTGESQPLPREGTIGSSRECDIRVKGADILRRHALFAFEEGKGLRITPSRRATMLLGGNEMTSPGYALHGTQLQLGDQILRVRLFAGLKVPHPAPFQEFPEEEGFSNDAPWLSGDAAEGTPPPFEFPEEGIETPEPMAVPMANPYDAEAMPPAFAPAPDYAGHYTEDGQMTWQYAAYPLEELRRAQAALDAQQAALNARRAAIENQSAQSPYDPAWQGEAAPGAENAYAPQPPYAPYPGDGQEEDAGEGLPYESPLPRRRRRSRK